MRPLRLDLRGFTVFREPTVIDLTDTDFFALVGPTGSGKSTILDAICFALYGTAPRWGGGRSVAYALAPSAAEGAVRLVFEAAGARYAVTRVVRRDGKGKVATRAAGLQALTPGFDPSTLDGQDLLDELGEALAGTPSELDAAISDVVGLPYDQFVKCVVLPQGEFAAFLHAKPAERQEILVRLLGLDVYDKVRERAATMAAAAKAQLDVTEPVLAALEAEACDEAIQAAQQRLEAARRLAAAVDAALPALAGAQQQVSNFEDQVGMVEQGLAVLASITAPADTASLAQAATQAVAAAQDAASAVGLAEEREEKVRAQLDSAADPADLRRLLDGYTELDRLRDQLAELDTAIAAATVAQQAAAQKVSQATARHDQAQTAVAAAQQALLTAQTADRAAWLRRDLVAGQPCPVCEQHVDTVPAMPQQAAMTAAKQVLVDAEQEQQRSRIDLKQAERAQAAADQQSALATGRRSQLDARSEELRALLADAGDPASLRGELAAVEQLRKALSEATAALRAAREAHRRAAVSAQRAEERLRAAWVRFDAARDSVAAQEPPAVDRDDLAGSWRKLTDWAGQRAAALRAELASTRAALAEAGSAVAAAVAALDGLFTEAGLPCPASGEHQRAATVAVERSSSAAQRLAEKRGEAEALKAQRAGLEAERQVAATLAQHLRANNFEAWLLAEALDSLVDGASEILRELSGGQYDLIHQDREFYVVDHHDAGLARAVRTLSGGETFQASLALALALAEQMAGLSPTASLESIILDEGFGTLDASTLDTVAATLENLAALGDRMVGVVTHVPSLAERIPVRFEISKDPRTARVNRIG